MFLYRKAMRPREEARGHAGWPRCDGIQHDGRSCGWHSWHSGWRPVVTVVLMGLSRLYRDTPEWVYWQAELVLLIAIELAYELTAVLSLFGILLFGVLFLLRRRRGQEPAGFGARAHAVHCPGLWFGLERTGLRGVDLTVASLYRRARRRPGTGRSQRALSTVRRTAAAYRSPLRFPGPAWRSSNRSGRTGRVERRGRSVSMDGCRSARSLHGSYNTRFPGDQSSWTSSPGRAIRWKSST